MSNENEKQADIESTAQSVEVVQMGALESIERAQIDMQIATAKRYPRVMSTVKSEMLSLACLDEETAAACFYTLPRGGKSIQGPSVRLAEIALSCYGNARAATRVISEVTDGPNPHVMLQAVCFDLQKNVAVSIEKRRRITKKKSKDRIDEDDINLAVNACAAIAFRDAVFKIVPGALVKPVTDQCKRTAVGDIKSLVTQRGKVIDRLKQMGVTEDRILMAVECKKIEDIDLDKLGTLIGLGTAVKDGMILEQAFPFPPHPGMTPQAPQPAGATPPKAEEKKPADKPADKAPDKAPEKSPAAPPPDADEAEAAADALRIQTERAAAAKVAAPAPPAPATETAPATAAAKPVKPPPFNEATHVPMMREKLKELHIGFKQVADYIVAEYRLKPEKPVANLTQLAAESPVSFQNVLFKHLVNPDKLAKIRGYAGQMTVEE